jgi:hypothetical protein
MRQRGYVWSGSSPVLAVDPSTAVMKRIADMICGPTIIVMASGRISRFMGGASIPQVRVMNGDDG